MKKRINPERKTANKSIFDSLGFTAHFPKNKETSIVKFIVDKKIIKLDGLSKKEVEDKIFDIFEIAEILAPKGFKFLEEWEIRMALLLIKNGITNFEYSVKFPTRAIVKRPGDPPELPDELEPGYEMKPGEREVDFLLRSPIKIPMATDIVKALEIKGTGAKSKKRGGLTGDNWRQQRELRTSKSKVKTLIILWQWIVFFEKYGLLSLDISDKEAFIQHLCLPRSFIENKNTLFDSMMQRMEYILRKNNIPFRTTTDNVWKRTIFLEEPTLFFWSDYPTSAIICVEDKFEKKHYLMRRFLSSVGIPAFLAFPQHLSFWKNWGFVRQYKEKVRKVNFSLRPLL